VCISGGKLSCLNTLNAIKKENENISSWMPPSYPKRYFRATKTSVNKIYYLNRK
jgi:hypothetical protein